jgi:hypothetical protein
MYKKVATHLTKAWHFLLPANSLRCGLARRGLAHRYERLLCGGHESTTSEMVLGLHVQQRMHQRLLRGHSGRGIYNTNNISAF